MIYPAVIVLDLLLAGTAIMGGVFVVPSLPRAWLAATPFNSYLFPALVLTLIGLMGLIGAIELSFERPLGVVASFTAGIGIAAYEVVQIAVLTFGNWLQLVGVPAGLSVGAEAPALHTVMWLEPIYIAFGLALASGTVVLYRQQASGGPALPEFR